jgi:hypothetical protein
MVLNSKKLEITVFKIFGFTLFEKKNFLETSKLFRESKILFETLNF